MLHFLKFRTRYQGKRPRLTTSAQEKKILSKSNPPPEAFPKKLQNMQGRRQST